MPEVTCPRCSMVLADDVLRCRYCGNTLSSDFWEAVRTSPSTGPQSSQRTQASAKSTRAAETLEPSRGANRKPSERLETATRPAADKKPASKRVVQNEGFTPPTVGWAVKAPVVALILVAVYWLWPSDSEGELQATDCRTQCFQQEKQMLAPPKHFMSGCMQSCMRPGEP